MEVRNVGSVDGRLRWRKSIRWEDGRLHPPEPLRADSDGGRALELEAVPDSLTQKGHENRGLEQICSVMVLGLKRLLIPKLEAKRNVRTLPPSPA